MTELYNMEIGYLLYRAQILLEEVEEDEANKVKSLIKFIEKIMED